jgi:hypothetical protein
VVASSCVNAAAVAVSGLSVIRVHSLPSVSETASTCADGPSPAEVEGDHVAQGHLRLIVQQVPAQATGSQASVLEPCLCQKSASTRVCPTVSTLIWLGKRLKQQRMALHVSSLALVERGVVVCGLWHWRPLHLPSTQHQHAARISVANSISPTVVQQCYNSAAPTCGTVTGFPSRLMVVLRLGSGSRRPRATTLCKPERT